MIARRKVRHPTAFEKMGIRIVLLEREGVESSLSREEIWMALLLLDRHSPTQIRRIAKRIRIIFVGAIVKAGAYLHVGKICVLNIGRIPKTCSERDRVIAIAALLVHEATHGIFCDRGIPSFGRAANRIERICESEQARVLERLDQLVTSGE
jgi:hypothetical protein